MVGEAVRRIARMMPVDPINPFGARHLINAVKSGETLVIFPEGRISVTGALMKVYDGTGLIADKGEAELLPVHISGAERTPFSRLNPDQVARKWFPKITMTVLAPRTLAIDPALVGRARRRAAGAALTDVMMKARMEVSDIHQTLFAALLARVAHDGASRKIVQDPLTGILTYRKLLVGAHVLGRKIADMTVVGERVGVLLPNSNGVAVTFFALQRYGRVPAMLNFTAGSANITSACVDRGDQTRSDLARLHRAGASSTPCRGRCRADEKIVFLEDVRCDDRLARQAPSGSRRKWPARRDAGAGG